MDNLPLSSAELQVALNRRLFRRATAKAEIALPAVPAMVDDYVTMCDETFRALGVEFSAEELGHLRGVLESQLTEAYAASSRSEIVISYDSPYGLRVNYQAKAQWFTVEGAYDNWVATREPPLFGTEPDARVCNLAAAAADPATFPVLDIGAGTGRNSLALARRGHPVDAVEMTEKFAGILRTEAQREGLHLPVNLLAQRRIQLRLPSVRVVEAGLGEQRLGRGFIPRVTPAGGAGISVTATGR